MWGVRSWLQQAARRDPDKLALITAGRSLSYGELLELAGRAGGAWTAQGVQPGDRVAIGWPDSESFAIAVHGALLLGAVIVPVDLRLGEAERALRSAGAVAVELPTEPESGPVAVPALVSSDQPLSVMHTSGTTWTPKPVVLSYGNWLASALGSAAILGLDLEERWLCPMPLVHVGGLSVLTRSAIYATTAILHERFDSDRVLAALMDEDEGITLVSLVPTMLSRLLDAGLREPPTLRWALLGGGPIAPSLLARAAQAGVPVAPSYGMTEACSQIATLGWPLPGMDVEIAADGEIRVRGASVAALELEPDGWLHTGDLGAWDDSGRLTITGRKADTIITGGENVAPTEVEAVLLAHPAVEDAAVFARADQEWGERIVAAVLLRDGAGPDEAALRAYCAERVAAFKVPKAIEFVTQLPRSPSGKLLRGEL